jgi:hypothetical protein
MEQVQEDPRTRDGATELGVLSCASISSVSASMMLRRSPRPALYEASHTRPIAQVAAARSRSCPGARDRIATRKRGAHCRVHPHLGIAFGFLRTNGRELLRDDRILPVPGKQRQADPKFE